MSGVKHTPGPWVWQPSDEYGYSALWNPDTRAEVIATSGRNDGDSPITWMGEDMWDADARLIAAAPDLLDALQNASGLIDTPIARRRYAADPFYADVIKSIRAAISKATGEA